MDQWKVPLSLFISNYQPYRKPNDDPLFIHSQSNHPPSITKQLPKTINKRISTLSSDRLSFDAAAPLYEEALRQSNFNVKMKYNPEDEASANRPKNQRNRHSNTVWYNPPFSKNVRSNIGRNCITLIDKHFPPSSNLHKIFNRNTMEISYSCMGNMRSTISKHNFRILAKTKSRIIDTCNCRRKDECPLPGKYQTTNVIYRANITTGDSGETKHYIGMTANPFKERYRNHTKSFKDKKCANETELSEYIWDILKRTATYTIGAKRCNLCLEEKISILKADKRTLLNKRSEHVSKCRHQNKFNISKCSLVEERSDESSSLSRTIASAAFRAKKLISTALE